MESRDFAPNPMGATIPRAAGVSIPRPETMRPRIGITCNFEADGSRPARQRLVLNAAYSDAVLAAGGIPRPIATPPAPDPELMRELLGDCDGLLFTGGPDLNPQHYGQPPHPRTQVLHERRDRFDIELFRLADQADKPILSICLGCQIANVARGGALVQHVDDLKRSCEVRHYNPDHSPAFHSVRIEPDSLLARIVGRTQMEVNSRHHQVIHPQQVGGRLRAVAFAPDGVVEAAEDAQGRFLLAVQWHPEDLIDRPEHLSLFRALVEHAARTRR